MPRIIFVSGVHGAGKSTLCGKLSEELGWMHYSCSDLIKQNSDYVEISKLVSIASRNQEALIRGISQLTEEVIILDGHFCLLDREEKIIELSFDVFDEISPTIILLATCDEATIHQRLNQRGGHILTKRKIVELQEYEIKRSKSYSTSSGCKLVEYHSPGPIERVLEILKSNY